MYEFTESELAYIHKFLAVSIGVRPAYRWHQKLSVSAEVDTNDVEDWAIAFYTAYNQKYPGTY